MINRRTLRCVSCGTRITTRTGIGHATVQVHRFACPNCKVEIGFSLKIDQKAPNFEYDMLTNAAWDDAEGDSEVTMLFYPEVMIPRELAPLMSPFVVTVHNLKDIKKYQSEEAIRRISKDELWPALQRAYVHFENGNLELMKKECQLVTKTMPELPNQEERAGWIAAVTRHFFDRFVARPHRGVKIERSVAVATNNAEHELRSLATEYVRSGRMATLWKELKSVRTQFLAMYESLQPLLMVRRYWKDHLQDVYEEYLLSNKNFDDLRSLYVDAVETAFKLLVIGLAVELIAKTGKPLITTKDGALHDVWWFEQLNNGIKDGQLKGHANLQLIMPALDLKLRNGVGHNAAHYSALTDEIVYVRADGPKLNEVRLRYTEFVDKIFQAYCAFELATIYFQWLFVAGGGHL